MAEERLDIVHMFRVEGLQSMANAGYEFQTMQENLAVLLPKLADVSQGMGLLSEEAVAGLSANMGLVTGGIAALAIGLPMLAGVIQQNLQQIREEFDRAEVQILESAESYEVYQRKAEMAYRETVGPLRMLVAEIFLGREGFDYFASSAGHSAEEVELFTWAVEASHGAIKEFNDEGDYTTEILGAIADEAASVNQALTGGLDDIAMFFADTERTMLDHQGDMETVSRRYQFIVEQMEREGYSSRLDAQRQALAQQLTTMDEQGEQMEQAAERRMGRMVLSEIDTLAKHSPEFAAAAWDMKRDVMLAYDLADERQLTQAEEFIRQLQQVYAQGPEGEAFQGIVGGAGAALPAWEGGAVTLPEIAIDTEALDAGVELLSDEMLAFQKVFAESGQRMSETLTEYGSDVTGAFAAIAADLALFREAQRQMFAKEFGAEVPFLPMITKSADTAPQQTFLPMIMKGPGVGNRGSSLTINIETLQGTGKKAAEEVSKTIAAELRTLGVNN